MLRASVAVVVVVRTHPKTIPLAMKTMRKPIQGFLYEYGAPLGRPENVAGVDLNFFKCNPKTYLFKRYFNE